MRKKIRIVKAIIYPPAMSLIEYTRDRCASSMTNREREQTNKLEPVDLDTGDGGKQQRQPRRI